MGDQSDSTTTGDINSPCQSGAQTSYSSQTVQAQSTVTHINFVNVGQVIHVSGENNIVHIPDTRITMHQQAVGMNPTIGLAAPSSSVPPQTDTPPPPQFYPPTTDHGTSYPTTRMGVFVGRGGTVTTSSYQETGFGTTQENPTYAEGPPEGIELVELTHKLMGVLGDNWMILGSYLNVPDYELVATEVEEKTLYRRVNRLLKFWVNLSEANDRKQLASVLSRVGQYHLGQCANEVFQKAPTTQSE